MSGYIGTAPVPQSTQTRETFTATAGQTTFNTGGYTAGYIDVYLNGVKLVSGTDYTATNGSDVVLLTGASAGDTLETVAYTAFTVADQTFTGNIVMADGLTVGNDGATVLTVDRATSDGTLVDFKKDGVSRGQIKIHGDRLVVGSGDASLKFDNGTNDILPWNIGTDAAQDNTVDLGSATARFNELFLGGGVYLGGTGSSNLLDDYEEGFFQPSFLGGTTDPTVTYDATVGREGWYVKVGSLVFIQINIRSDSVSGGSGTVLIGGLPFVSANKSSQGGIGNFFIGDAASWGSNTPSAGGIGESLSNLYLIYRASSTSATSAVQISDMATGANSNLLRISGVYYTDA